MKKIYFDHSATTPVHQEVVATMINCMTSTFGNPSSVHSYGRESQSLLEEARQKVADLFGASSNEIIFTSGGTEADNLAIQGIAKANQKKGKHIITSVIEHHAVLHTCEYLETQGFEVTYLPVDEYGLVQLIDLIQAVRDDTILISIMFANNEVGTIQPIKEIGTFARQKGIYLHTDAVGAAGNYPIDVNEYNIDLMTISGHKFYGPKGVGALFVRQGVNIQAVQFGGGHENSMRAGTENMPGIVGLGKACEMAKHHLSNRIEYVSSLRDKLIREILAKIPDAKLNGHPTLRVPGNINFSFLRVEGESLLLRLDLEGIAASSGSACSSGGLNPSHVLLAMGLAPEDAHGSLRITLGCDNTDEEVDYCVNVLPEIIFKLRTISPL
jgi:cysteine desulfurase